MVCPGSPARSREMVPTTCTNSVPGCAAAVGINASAANTDVSVAARWRSVGLRALVECWAFTCGLGSLTVLSPRGGDMGARLRSRRERLFSTAPQDMGLARTGPRQVPGAPEPRGSGTPGHVVDQSPKSEYSFSVKTSWTG